MKLISIKEVSFDPSNVRKHDEKNIDAIAASLKRFGQQKPIVVDQNNIVRAGNGTLAAAKKLGWDRIGVVVSDLEPAELTAYAIADNRTSELAEWDMDGLTDQLKSLDDELRSVAYDDFELPEVIPEASEKDDDISETKRNEFGVTCGDIWKLGEHTLFCGDATQIESYEKLLGETKANMVFTDPPYNVNYEGKNPDKLTIQNDNQKDEIFYKFLYDAFTNMYIFAEEGAPIYICHADTEGINFRKSLIESGWLLKQVVVWIKNKLAMSRQDYHWKHEPILYGWKAGKPHIWNSDRKQTTCWNFDRPNKNTEHPTMKPIALVQYAIMNSSKSKSTILDPFSGSGSTIIACEKTNRKCYGMELDPHYCFVIIKRWQDFTGKEAKRG